MSLFEITESAGTDRMMVRRLLEALIACNIVMEDAAGFRIGAGVVLLTNGFFQNPLVRELAPPHLWEIQSKVIVDRP